MVVTKINDGKLAIAIPQNSELAKAPELEWLDTRDGKQDGQVDIEAIANGPLFGTLSKKQKANLLRRIVAASLAGAGEIQESQVEGVAQLFDYYNQIRQFKDLLESWQQRASVRESFFGAKTLVFNAADWKAYVSPSFQVYQTGVATEANRLRGWLWNVLDGAAGKNCVKTWFTFGGPEIDETLFPPIVRNKAKEIWAWDRGIREFFSDHNRIKCEGEGCPLPSTFPLSVK